MSEKSLPSGNERIAHIAAFVTLGLIGLFVVGWSGVRVYDSQPPAKVVVREVER